MICCVKRDENVEKELDFASTRGVVSTTFPPFGVITRPRIFHFDFYQRFDQVT